MSNTSATGGYLVPSGLAPTMDAGFEDQIQAIIVGITGLPGERVVPRWQPVPPRQPEIDVDWCAVGITSVDQDANAAIIHHDDGDGFDESQRHEILSVVASFYGPDCYGYASRFRDGLWISQNRDVMMSQGMGLYDVGQTVTLSGLINEQNVRRVDFSFRLRRAVVRTYPVLNILSADGTIYTDELIGNPISETFSVEP